MFKWLKRDPHQVSIRYRCLCGEKYERDLGREFDGMGCLRCGRIIPVMVSEFGGPWRSYREQQLLELRAQLKAIPRLLRKVLPAEERANLVRHLKERIKRYEDGTWVTEYIRAIPGLEEMANAACAGDWKMGTPGLETPEKTGFAMRLQIRRFKEELEVAGKSP